MGRCADSTEVVLCRAVELLMVVLVQRLTEPFNSAQRGPQIVGDRVGECLQFLVGGFELQTPAHDFLLGSASLGNIARDFYKSAQGAAIVTQGRDHNVCPKA